MPKVRFTGRVLPSALNITITNHPRIESKDDNSGLHLFTTIAVIEGVVSIECDLNKFVFVEHYNEVVAQAYRLGKIAIDLTAFARGYGLTFVLDSFTDPHGVITPTASHNPELPPLATSVRDDRDFAKILTMLLDNSSLAMGLHDLTSALASFDRTAISCALAVESLRAYFMPPNGNKEDGWPLLQRNLQLTRSFLIPITEASRGPRHGDHAPIASTITLDVSRRAWIVMNRFFEYHKRGNQSLPESEFPLLS
jgi:hypothetical protein